MRAFPATAFGVLTTLTAAAALAGCGSDEPRRTPSVAPPSATVAVGALPSTLDPARATSAAERAIAAAAHTPLLTYRRASGPDAGTLIPALARKLPRLVENEREYRFSLRPGLLYADGRLVTASDVERAIAHASKVATDSGLRAALASIKGAPSKDGQTLTGVRSDDVTGNVVISLRRADGRIPYALADPATAPIPELPRGEAQEPTTSTGPLRVARRTGRVVELVANPLRPSIREVPAARFQRVTLVRGGPVAEELDLDLVPPITEPELATRQTAPSGPTWLLALRTDGVFSSRGTRAKLARGIDRAGLPAALRVAEPGAGSSRRTGLRALVAACGVIAPYVAGAVDREPCPPTDRSAPAERAPTLSGMSVVIATDRGPAGAVLAGRITELLTALGARVDAYSVPDALAEVSERDADAALVRLAPGLAHPESWIEPFGVADALVAREAPRLTRGPLTGAADDWAALDERLVGRFTVIPLASERRTVDVGPALMPSSVVLHPILGLDLAALAPR